ncbi:MAG: GAF domain-containing protein [Anaerolineales bacterium]|nr:GAF domain-containing protein [Anaerolineales bacterium]
MIRRLFSPPNFERDEDNFRAKFINGFAWSVIILTAFAILPNFGANADANAFTTILVLSGLILVMFASLYFLRRRNLNISGLIIVVLGWLALGIQAYTADGVKDVIIVAYIAVSLLASIVINWRIGSIVIIFSIGAIWTLAILESNGFLSPRVQEPFAFSRDISFIFIAIAVLIYFSTTSLRDAITRANKSEQSLLSSNRNLQELNQTLEERVSQRTTELDMANRFNLRRARQFEAISQVIRAVSSIQDLDTLLPRITEVISEQFNTYHTGIFLLDNERVFAVLRASNSEGGQKMLSRGHKLQVGQTGIVGFVTATGQPRIALDVGVDAAFFDNPDLPNTHSEIALPLRYGGQVIGALDVQSTESNAFSQEDVEILITLADQVAIAINNTLNLEEAQKTLAESKSAIGKSTLESWMVLRPKSLGLGFQLTDSIITPLAQPLKGNHIEEALTKGRSIISNEHNEPSSLAIPIRLRGQVIGVMNLRTQNNRQITSDDADIAEAVSDRLSLAIETATLLQSTQHRADIERVTTDISSKISSSTRFETILQTAAQELSRALGGSDVIVQIEPASVELGMSG